jgi:hypothetical protein
VINPAADHDSDDCGRELPIDVHDAGSCFYVGQVCPVCLVAGEIYGIFATRQEADAFLRLLTSPALNPYSLP